MKVLIGTTNPSKADWLGGLIGAGTELLTLGDVNISAEPSETGATPAENAAIKAEFYGKTFQPVVCHDSGLYFAELALDDPRQPGLHVRTPNGRARFCNDEEMLAYYAALVHSLGGAATAMYLNGFAVFADGKLSTFASSRLAVGFNIGQTRFRAVFYGRAVLRQTAREPFANKKRNKRVPKIGCRCGIAPLSEKSTRIVMN